MRLKHMALAVHAPCVSMTVSAYRFLSSNRPPELARLLSQSEINADESQGGTGSFGSEKCKSSILSAAIVDVNGQAVFGSPEPKSSLTKGSRFLPKSCCLADSYIMSVNLTNRRNEVFLSFFLSCPLRST